MKSFRFFQQCALGSSFSSPSAYGKAFDSFSACAVLFHSASFISAMSSIGQRRTPTFYDRLGVKINATQEDIKKQYRVRALETHPDLASASGTDKTKAATEFRLVAEAYETLSVPQKRAVYDEKIMPKRSAATAETKTRDWSASAEAGSAAASASYTAQAAFKKKKMAKQQQQRPFTSQFVAKDAQRIFREVFGGNSVHDVLFSQEFERKYGKKAPGGNPTAMNDDDDEDVDTSKQQQSSSVSPDDSSSQQKQQQKQQRQQKKEQEEEEWHQAFKQAQQEVLDRFRREHPYANPRDVRVSSHRRAAAGYQPEEPPGTEFPFRPCAGLRFPEGVSPGKDVQPTMGVVADFAAEDIVAVADSPASAYGRDQTTFRGDKELLADDPDAYMAKLAKYGRTPHNEGQLYSFRRPY